MYFILYLKTNYIIFNNYVNHVYEENYTLNNGQQEKCLYCKNIITQVHRNIDKVNPTIKMNMRISTKINVKTTIFKFSHSKFKSINHYLFKLYIKLYMKHNNWVNES